MSYASSAYTNNKMHGVVDKLFICQNERTDALNKRISSRNIPSAPLQPFYYQVPVSTKYGYMPILDQSKPSTVALNNYPVYSPHTTFNPGNNMAPWSGFSNNVNIEYTLRNQFFALQDCEQAEYVPSSKSDLFNVRVPENYVQQPYPDLFNRQQFCPHNPNEHNIANNFFNNSTRNDIKNL